MTGIMETRITLSLDDPLLNGGLGGMALVARVRSWDDLVAVGTGWIAAEVKKQLDWRYREGLDRYAYDGRDYVVRHIGYSAMVDGHFLVCRRMGLVVLLDTMDAGVGECVIGEVGSDEDFRVSNKIEYWWEKPPYTIENRRTFERRIHHTNLGETIYWERTV